MSLGALASGCSHNPDALGDVQPADVYDGVQDIDANLSRLAALDVFEVGDLVLVAPEGAFNCYGPCPGYENWEDEARLEAAARLGEFTAAAERAAVDPEDYAQHEIEASLESLRNLQLVEIGDMIQSVAPPNSANAYSAPNEEDILTAMAENEARADRLQAIADSINR